MGKVTIKAQNGTVIVNRGKDDNQLLVDDRYGKLNETEREVNEVEGEEPQITVGRVENQDGQFSFVSNDSYLKVRIYNDTNAFPNESEYDDRIIAIHSQNALKVVSSNENTLEIFRTATVDEYKEYLGDTDPSAPIGEY